MIDVEVTAGTTHSRETLVALLNGQGDMRAVERDGRVLLTDVCGHQDDSPIPVVKVLDEPTGADMLASLDPGAWRLVTVDCRIATVNLAVPAAAYGLSFVASGVAEAAGVSRSRVDDAPSDVNWSRVSTWPVSTSTVSPSREPHLGLGATAAGDGSEPGAKAGLALSRSGVDAHLARCSLRALADGIAASSYLPLVAEVPTERGHLCLNLPINARTNKGLRRRKI